MYRVAYQVRRFEKYFMTSWSDQKSQIEIEHLHSEAIPFLLVSMPNRANRITREGKKRSD